jgi:hypothetical protein
VSLSSFGFEVAWPVFHPLTLLHLNPILRLTLMMMKKKRKAKKMMTSEASRRPPPHFLVFNDKWGEISIKA